MVDKWPLISSRPGPDLRLFRVRYDLLENPRNNLELERLVLETPEWVNVVALTPERQVVIVRQFRFGPADITAEIPGGMVDPGEDSGAAARRELREESGYTSDRWSYLGSVQANPAIHDNLCHHWLAEEARATHPLEQDEGEDIEVSTCPLGEIPDLIRSGEMRHSLVISALSRLIAIPRTED